MIETMTDDQRSAMEKLNEFLRSPEGTAFLVEGGAGTGKTWLLGKLLSGLRPPVAVCAPTHKAINVLRRKLAVPWCVGYDAMAWDGEEVITGTTAQLLGIAPIIADDQGTELKFGRTGRGILDKLVPSVVIVDEVSMLGWGDFRRIRETLKRAGCKVVAVGDAGQLPPVRTQAIPFDRFLHKATLREIVRQAEGSAIIRLAWAIREGEDWRRVTGPGVRAVDNVAGEFLEAVEIPGKPEEDRSVFVAYTNRLVDRVQDAACQRLYGHGRGSFAAGELVIAECNLYRDKVLLCANQDELLVESIDERHPEPFGVPVVLRPLRGRGHFRALYLSQEDRRRPDHPYNRELAHRAAEARRLQDEWKRARSEAINQRRKRAWARFFELRDQTVISFRHPFALTSHKAQGSTYKRVFADTGDLGRFSRQALYVAATRPRDELVHRA